MSQGVIEPTLINSIKPRKISLEHKKDIIKFAYDDKGAFLNPPYLTILLYM